MKKTCISLFNADKKVSKGQSLAEYGLILALIAVVCIGAIRGIGTSVDTKLRAVQTAINP